MPYVRLCPDFCFSVDPGDGSPVVGYVICAPNTKSFVEDWEQSYIPPQAEADQGDIGALWKEDLPAALLEILYSPKGMLHSDFPHLLQDYPAHLHIDILPDFQRHGLGTKLIQKLCDKLRGEKVKGVHLVMDGKNTGAEKFYYAVGFKRFPEVLDGGKSGEQGRDKNNGLWMVKSILEG